MYVLVASLTQSQAQIGTHRKGCGREKDRVCYSGLDLPSLTIELRHWQFCSQGGSDRVWGLTRESRICVCMDHASHIAHSVSFRLVCMLLAGHQLYIVIRGLH